MVTLGEISARRSIAYFIVLVAFIIAAAIFVINKGLETISDIETIENAPILTLRRHLLESSREGAVRDIKKWRVYRNADYGIEMRFPADYRLAARNIELVPAGGEEGALIIVDADRKTAGEAREENDRAECSLQLTVGENPDRLTLTEWIRRLDNRVSVNEELTSIDGELAIRRAGSDRLGNPYTEVHISYKNRVFTFTLTAVGAAQGYGQCREEFDLILSTVKFIR